MNVENAQKLQSNRESCELKEFDVTLLKAFLFSTSIRKVSSASRSKVQALLSCTRIELHTIVRVRK